MQRSAARWKHMHPPFMNTSSQQPVVYVYSEAEAANAHRATVDLGKALPLLLRFTLVSPPPAAASRADRPYASGGVFDPRGPGSELPKLALHAPLCLGLHFFPL